MRQHRSLPATEAAEAPDGLRGSASCKAADHQWHERNTFTDGDAVALARDGVPMVLLSLPLKYMHTTVETLDIQALKEGSRLPSHFLSELDAGWEDDRWI